MEDENAAEVFKALGEKASVEAPAIQDSGGPNNALEQAKSQLSCFSDSRNESLSVSVEIPSSTFGQPRPLRDYTPASELGLGTAGPRNNLSGDNPDDADTTTDNDSDSYDAGNDVGYEDTFKPGDFSAENSDHSSFDDSSRSIRLRDREEDGQSLKTPMRDLAVSVTNPRKKDVCKKDANAPTPSKKAGRSHQRATRKPEPQASRPSRKKLPEIDIKISEEQMTRSMELGLRMLVGWTEVTASLYPQIELSEDDERDFPASSKPRKATQEGPMQKLERMLATGSAIQGAQKNASRPEIPISEQMDKAKALKEIAEKIMQEEPAANRREVMKDVRNLIAASRQFRHKPRMDGSGWKTKGMKQNLLHHQVEGAGWMCARETTDSIPRGGMLCDMMGLGKTFTTLSCILDGRPQPPRTRRAPTLIIVPVNARRHWLRQIDQGFHIGVFGQICEWTYDTERSVTDVNGLRQYGIVLATHEHIRRSYPSLYPPEEIRTDKEKMEWWMEQFEDTVGVLHKVNWHRIVLDEGHEIRNSATVLSLAARALTGERRWILTGTPMFNRTEDLFAYFNFLGVPNCQFFKSFRDEFCKRGCEAVEHLHGVLEPFFHRRTYASTLFCRPIVPVPKIVEQNIPVEFWNIEKVIYDEVLNMCVEDFNAHSGSREMQNKCILEIITRLRQVSSHFLAAQVVVKPLLGAIKLTLKDAAVETESFWDRDSTELWRFVELLTSGVSPTAASQPTLHGTSLEHGSSKDRIGLKRACKERAQGFAAEENWEEYDAIATGECTACLAKLELGQAFLVTSCHHYCKGCYESLPSQDGAADSQRKVCLKCKAEITNAADFHPRGFLLAAGESSASFMCPGWKRKRANTGKDGRNKSQKTEVMSKRNERTDESEDVEDSTSEDWIPLLREYHLGTNWLGSKITKVRDIVRKWMQEDKGHKIVIFMHFLDSQRILEAVCEQEKWHYTKISGKMAPSDRDDQIQAFQHNDKFQIMLSSYGTGGTAIDLTAANKCILMDGWWNMARDEQACFRLFRIGQKRDVEFFKVIAHGTLDGQGSIDQQMYQMQRSKMKNTLDILGESAFSNEGAAKSFLQNLGDHVKDGNGHIKLVRRRRNPPSPRKEMPDNDPVE